MPKTRWRPPVGTVYGVCPSCRLWAPLTAKGYVREHNYVVVNGRPNRIWRAGDAGVVVVRCSATGRDPLKHECTPPDAATGAALPSMWTCSCGLQWRHAHGRWRLRLY